MPRDSRRSELDQRPPASCIRPFPHGCGRAGAGCCPTSRPANWASTCPAGTTCRWSGAIRQGWLRLSLCQRFSGEPALLYEIDTFVGPLRARANQRRNHPERKHGQRARCRPYDRLQQDSGQSALSRKAANYHAENGKARKSCQSDQHDRTESVALGLLLNRLAAVDGTSFGNLVFDDVARDAIGGCAVRRVPAAVLFGDEIRVWTRVIGCVRGGHCIPPESPLHTRLADSRVLAVGDVRGDPFHGVRISTCDLQSDQWSSTDQVFPAPHPADVGQIRRSYPLDT